MNPSSTAPISKVNAKAANGVAPGYVPTKGSGLTLNIGPGNAVFGAPHDYAGGTLTLADNTTNYVYLDSSSAFFTPASNTTGFTVYNAPIAIVTTSGGVITAIQDWRSPFNIVIPPPSGPVELVNSLTGDGVVFDNVASQGDVTLHHTTFTDGQLLIGNTGTGWVSKSTLTAGSGITVTNGSGTITIAATGGGGTVTVTGSPVAGNLTQFSGASSITNVDLTQDVTTSGTSATTVVALRNKSLDTSVGTPSNGQVLIYDSGIGKWKAGPVTNIYDAPGFGIPGQPASGAIVGQFSFPRAVSYPANFSGAVGACVTNPISTVIFKIYQISGLPLTPTYTQIGTVSVNSTGTFSFASTGGSPQAFAANDVMQLVAPIPQDPNLANISITFTGTR